MISAQSTSVSTVLTDTRIRAASQRDQNMTIVQPVVTRQRRHRSLTRTQSAWRRTSRGYQRVPATRARHKGTVPVPVSTCITCHDTCTGASHSFISYIGHGKSDPCESSGIVIFIRSSLPTLKLDIRGRIIIDPLLSIAIIRHYWSVRSRLKWKITTFPYDSILFYHLDNMSKGIGSAAGRRFFSVMG